MRILLVDDEPAALDGLEFIITEFRGDYHIVARCNSAQQAIGILESEAVDLLITDVKMHGMSGVELVEWACRHCPDVYSLVFSAYSDFEFVRQCLKSGAVDYILKPSNYAVILDMIDDVAQKVQLRERGRMVQDDERRIRLALAGDGSLPAGFGAGGQLFPVFVREVEGKVSRHGQSIAHIEVRSAQVDSLLILLPPDMSAQRALIQCLLAQRRQVVFACIANEPSMLRAAFQQAEEALQFASFNELVQPLELASYRQHADATRQIRLSDFICAERLGELLIMADAVAIRKLIAGGFRQLTDKHGPVEPVQLKSKLMSMLLSLEKNLGAHNFNSIAASITGKEFDLFAELERLKTIDMLTHWVINFLICAAEEAKYSLDMPPYMYDAIEFMHGNYMKKLTLHQVADHVHLNPWYLSVQMKKHVGASFSEYLCQVRIGKAKSLLNQSDLKIYQVAEMCGFQEASYFNAVFKRLEGIAPSEYLKQRAAGR